MFKKKHKQAKQPNLGKVIIPTDMPKPPEPHEVEAAWTLAHHFQCTVEFLKPVEIYKHKSADIKMNNVIWEIKSPKGKSKSTIQNQFRKGSKQSVNIVLDTRRTTLLYKIIEKRALVEVKNRPYMKRVILIDKSKKIVELKI